MVRSFLYLYQTTPESDTKLYRRSGEIVPMLRDIFDEEFGTSFHLNSLEPIIFLQRLLLHIYPPARTNHRHK